MRWITRSHVHVDRVACPWLITRFADSDAEFIFVPKSQIEKVAGETDAIPFDAPGVELGHKDGRCSFESIMLKYDLKDPALLRMTKIVHSADVKEDIDADPIARGYGLEQLVHDRFRLREAVQAKIAGYRNAAKQVGFQRCLLPEMRLQLDVSPQYAFRFSPDQYPANWYYEGKNDFQKHYYRAIGELKDEGKEFACAQFIDRLPQVKHWVRNLDRRGFWFQTSTNKFYPGFVAELTDGRYLIVEYKGWDCYSSDVAKEKRAVGELWQALSGVREYSSCQPAVIWKVSARLSYE